MRILVVDDEMFARRTLFRMLNKPDVEVILCNNAIDGYEMYEKTQPDIAICDVMMAGVNGDWLITKILQHFPKANLIVCSGKPQEELLKYKLMGAKACITKPIKYEKLWNEIMSIIGNEVAI